LTAERFLRGGSLDQQKGEKGVTLFDIHVDNHADLFLPA
jgi:hypothetical protein